MLALLSDKRAYQLNAEDHDRSLCDGPTSRLAQYVDKSIKSERCLSYLSSVTGASSGFGRLLTEAILKHGEIVVATARNTSTLSSLALLHPSNRLLVLHCDVTRPADIRAAFAQIIERFRRCDVVFNNAGFGVVSEAESTAQDELAREMFEVNFWGAANVSREAVRIFRDVNPKGEGGRLITVSSAAGFTAYPAFGYYSARYGHPIRKISLSMG